MRHQHRQLLIAILALGLAGLVGACDETGTNGDGGGGGDGKVQPDAGPPPEGIFFKSKGESAELNFKSGSEAFMVVPYSVSETTAASIDFEIKLTKSSSGSVGSTSYPLRITRQRPSLKLRNPALWARWQRRLTTEAWTRSLMHQAAKMKMSPPRRPLNKTIHACTLSKDCAATEVCDNTGTCASTVKIKVEKFSKATTTPIDAEVKKKGTIAAVLVDKNDTSVTQSTIDALLNKFEQEIYPCDKGLFGNPPLKSGGTTLSTDRNGDGLIWIVLTSKVQDAPGGGSVGFFIYTDFADATSEATSNEADILYIDAAQSGTAVLTTVTHELQHLLNYAVKVYKPKQAGGQGAVETLWLDEGQSHFAEDACGYGGENVTLLNDEVFPNFSDTAMLESANDSLPMRGMALTFVRYLFEQKGGVSYAKGGSITDNGGATFLAGLHTSSAQGGAAVTDAYGDYKAAMGPWLAALTLDGRSGAPVDDKRYKYQDLVTHPDTSNQVGMKIRGTRKDESGTDTKLDGLLEEDLTADTSDSIPNGTAKFFLLKGQTGKVSVSVTSQDTDFRFAVIQVK